MPANIEQGFATKAIHAGHDPMKSDHHAVIAPLIMSTTFQQSEPNANQPYCYGRSGNPTRDTLEACLAALDNGKHALVFSSGLGATTTLTGLLESGDHILCGDDVYGGTNRFFQKCAVKQNIRATFVDVCKVDAVLEAVKPNTKMIWIETPTNPMLKIGDIKSIVDRVKAKRSDIIIVVDNTFVTCFFQKPLDLGADVVMYSLTKYINGHSDVIMGAAVTKSDDIEKRLRFLQNAMGIIPSPFDCSQVLRSLKTLEIRMQRHSENGLLVANYLETHPQVTKVLHPYLPSHPQHELARKQMTGHSGMVSFCIKGSSAKFLKALKIFALAESLGGFESLAELPSVMTHASVPEQEREALGISDQLIRLSVGLETAKDLVADLDQALKTSAQ